MNKHVFSLMVSGTNIFQLIPGDICMPACPGPLNQNRAERDVQYLVLTTYPSVLPNGQSARGGRKINISLVCKGKKTEEVGTETLEGRAIVAPSDKS